MMGAAGSASSCRCKLGSAGSDPGTALKECSCVVGFVRQKHAERDVSHFVKRFRRKTLPHKSSKQSGARRILSFVVVTSEGLRSWNGGSAVEKLKRQHRAHEADAKQQAGSREPTTGPPRHPKQNALTGGLQMIGGPCKAQKRARPQDL